MVEAKVGELVGLGPSAQRRTRPDDPEDAIYSVVRRDLEGNECCLSWSAGETENLARLGNGSLRPHRRSVLTTRCVPA
jgi:hypothetical protein